MSRLPKPPERTAFHTDKDGNYRHTVMPADLRLTGKFIYKGAITGRLVNTGSNTREISKKPDKNPGKCG